MPERDHDAANQHRALAAEHAIADPAARQAGQVGGAHVHAVDRRRGAVIEPESAMRYLVHQEQDQQRPHAVEAQPLPHLDEEQGRDARRVSEDGAPRGRIQAVSCALASAAALLRLRIAANRMPPSYSRYIGTAMAVCDSTSGGVRIAAMMNTMIST